MTTIGVFDSGFGGLTVLRELLRLNGGTRYIYLGDTARLPYGSKSRETIARYAVSSARFLHEQGAQHLVIACNTASALALEDIRTAVPIPVIGVIEPGAEAALQASSAAASAKTSGGEGLVKEKGVSLSEATGGSEVEEPALNLSKGHAVPIASAAQKTSPHALVLATAATVQSHAYTRALNNLGLHATEKACPLLVPLIEEGWTSHSVTAEVLRIYLLEALAEAPAASVLLLGCTHYPLIRPLLNTTLHELHHPMQIIDSAEATARALAAQLHLHTTIPQPATDNLQPATTFYATDSIEKFQRLGAAFLGQPVSEVHHLDLGG